VFPGGIRRIYFNSGFQFGVWILADRTIKRFVATYQEFVILFVVFDKIAFSWNQYLLTSNVAFTTCC
jgi:hypothetical protein